MPHVDQLQILQIMVLGSDLGPAFDAVAGLKELMPESYGGGNKHSIEEICGNTCLLRRTSFEDASHLSMKISVERLSIYISDAFSCQLLVLCCDIWTDYSRTTVLYNPDLVLYAWLMLTATILAVKLHRRIRKASSVVYYIGGYCCLKGRKVTQGPWGNSLELFIVLNCV